MTWIKSSVNLAYHPKMRKFCRILDISVPEGIGYLHLLWWWGIECAENGELKTFECEDIADSMMWKKDPEDLIKALKGAGFVDSDLKIHDWDEYVGALLAQREANRARAKRAYEKSKEDNNFQMKRNDDSGIEVDRSSVNKKPF